MQTEAKLNAQVIAGEASNKAAWFPTEDRKSKPHEMLASRAAVQAAVITKEAEKRSSRVRNRPAPSCRSLSQEALHSPHRPEFLWNPAEFLPHNASTNTLLQTWTSSTTSLPTAPVPSVPSVWSPHSSKGHQLHHKSCREARGNSLEYVLDVPHL